MEILLIAATEMEISAFATENPGINTLITGVGVPAAIYHLQKKLQEQPYQLIIQAGIAGTFDTGLDHGEVIQVEQDCFADLGIHEKGNLYSPFEMGFADPARLPYRQGVLKNPHHISSLDHYRKVNGVTVNMITDDPAVFSLYADKYQARVESMEGAALHFVCLQEGIPFVQLRAISNAVGERDKATWQIGKALTGLQKAITECVENFG